MELIDIVLIAVVSVLGVVMIILVVVLILKKKQAMTAVDEIPSTLRNKENAVENVTFDARFPESQVEQTNLP